MRAVQQLIIYKRHTPECPVHEVNLPEGAKRFWMECECPIWVYGRTPQGHVVPRQTTGARTKEDAEIQVKAIIARSAAIAQQDAVLSGDELEHGPTITDCAQRYLDSRRPELSDKTYGQTKLMLDRLAEYCGLHGVYRMRGLTVDLLERFKVEGLPGLADTSKSTVVAKLRRFLKDAYRREWIEHPLVEKVTSHAAVYQQKQPFTDEQVSKILDEALNLNGGTHGYAKHPKTFRLLLELMLETGMRVSDAIRYDPSRCVKGKFMWAYPFMPMKQKRIRQPKTMKVYPPEKLKKAIDDCEWLSAGLPFCWGNFDNPSYLANEVYARMQSIGSRCDVDDCRPHRLRDTFAVRKLLAGFPLEYVTRLLGHSSVKVTEQYYAAWISDRELQVERRLAETLVDA